MARPLREPTYFILAALLDGPLHGWGVVKRVSDLSEGRVRLTAGTLYGALERLLGAGMVAVDREETVEGRRRRYFRLTGEGSAAVASEAERLAASARVVLERPRQKRQMGASVAGRGA